MLKDAISNSTQAIVVVASFIGTAILFWKRLTRLCSLVSAPFKIAAEQRRQIYSKAISNHDMAQSNHKLLLELTEKLQNIEKENASNTGMKESLNRIERSLGSNTWLTLQSLNLASVACFTSDPKGRWQWVSVSWSELAGMSFEKALHFGWTLAVAERDKERVYKEWILCCEEDRPFLCRYAFRGVAGEVPVEVEAVPMKDTGGATYGFFGRVQKVLS